MSDLQDDVGADGLRLLGAANDELRERLSRIEQSAEDGPESVDEVLRAALDELRENLEERLVVEEELRVQSRELEEALAAVVQEREQFRRLFQRAPVGYLVTDSHGVIRMANGTIASMLGVRQDRLVGKPIQTLVGIENRPGLRTWLSQLRDARAPASTRVTFKTRHGDDRTADVTVAPAARHGDREATLRWIVSDAGSAETETAGESLPEFEEWSGGEDGTRGPRSSASIRAVIVDDNEIFARGLDVLIASLPVGTVEVVATSRDRERAYDLVLSNQPDLLVLATSTDHEHLDRVARIKKDFPRVSILAIVEPQDMESTAARVRSAGADGVLSRVTPPEQVLGPVLAVADGWTVMPRDLSDAALLDHHARERLADLDEEDRALLRAIAAGRSDTEIADAIHTSTRTAKRRVAALYKRLDVGSRIDAAALAGAAGLLAPRGE